MAGQGGEQAYATLLLNDAYLPGALVLAHSLRDAGTTKKLLVLVTLDSVSAEAITQLKSVYDMVIPVPRIQNARPANLYLMNRADLHSAFTKINLWKQLQFSKIVYIDADVVAYRAPDELFAISAPFAAAPDIGWPDLFNTGVMVLTPNMGDYYAMMAMAERGISFDGADQGLLNMHFGDKYHRLSFTYNVTPSAHYQYIPAYRHFQSSINMVHFIGPDKPWFQGRHAAIGDSPFDEMVARWWAVYDKHYRAQESVPTPPQPASELVQYYVKGEFQPTATPPAVPTGEHSHVAPRAPSMGTSPFQPLPPVFSHDHEYRQSSYGQPQGHHQHPQDEPQPGPQGFPGQGGHGDGQHEHHEHHGHPHHEHHQPYHGPPHHPDPQHQHQHYEPGPPPHSESGQASHEHHHYPPAQGHWPPPEQSSHSHRESFSHDPGVQAEARSEQVSHQPGPPPPPPAEHTHASQPPPMQPSWDAQHYPPPIDSRPEALNFPLQVYEMSQDVAPFVPPERYPSPPRNMWYEVPKEPPAPPTERPRAIFPWEGHQPRPTRSFFGESQLPTPFDSTSETESDTIDHKSEPATPTTPTIRVMQSDPWTSFTRTNAWDDVPAIERYVEGLQKHRRGKSQVLPGLSPGMGIRAMEGQEGRPWRSHGLKLTDFPSEVERPSLPVTPAPIRRPKFWGGGGPGVGEGDVDELLPAAEGVPTQFDWDPIAQLQKLARQQSEALLRKLGGDEGGSGSEDRDLPSRPLPFGSEGITSPTYVAQSSDGVVLSPQPVKGSTTTSKVRGLGDEDPSAAMPRSMSEAGGGASLSVGSGIPEPAYGGPGLAWEKGEDVPPQETPALPTEEDRDVLET